MRLAPVRLAHEGLKIFMLQSDQFLESGRAVDLEHPYWMGHLADGSIIEITDPAPADAGERKKR